LVQALGSSPWFKPVVQAAMVTMTLLMTMMVNKFDTRNKCDNNKFDTRMGCDTSAFAVRVGIEYTRTRTRTRTLRKGATPASADIYTRKRGDYRNGATPVLGTGVHREGVIRLLGLRKASPASAEINTRNRGDYMKGATLVIGTDGYRKGATLVLGSDGFRKGVTPLLCNDDGFVG